MFQSLEALAARVNALLSPSLVDALTHNAAVETNNQLAAKRLALIIMNAISAADNEVKPYDGEEWNSASYATWLQALDESLGGQLYDQLAPAQRYTGSWPTRGQDLLNWLADGSNHRPHNMPALMWIGLRSI